MALDQRRKRRRELENFYTDSLRQQAFFKFLESPKTTCPARNFLFWLDVEAYRLQRRLAKSGGVKMTKQNDYDVCKTIYEKYVKSGAPYPIFMPNYTKLDITSTMEKFSVALMESSGPDLCPHGEHVFDEAQNAVEVSLYRALTQFERELLQEKKVVDAVISTDAEGASVFISGSFPDLMHWFFLDCPDDRFAGELSRLLYIYRIFETPHELFSHIDQCLRNPDSMTTNNFDKDLIVARTKNALRTWLMQCFVYDIDGDEELLGKIKDLIGFTEREMDDRKLRPFFNRFIESPLEFPQQPKGSGGVVDLGRWSAKDLAEQMTLVDALQYYATNPEELFSIGESSGAPHITTLTKRVDLIGGWVAVSILSSAKPGLTLKMFVSVLEKLFALNNYNGLKAVLTGVDHPAVVRLKKAYKGLDKGEKDFLAEIRQLVDTTELYKRHLEALGEVACVPYIGTHVRLMTEIYGKNANKIQTEKGINYQPARAIADVMFNYLRFQKYRFQETHKLRVIDELFWQLQDIMSVPDTQLHAMSAALQPLDRKEKKGSTTTSPQSSGGSRLANLFGAKPKKLNSQRIEADRPRSMSRARSNSMGEDEME